MKRQPQWTLKEFAESKGLTESALRKRMQRSGVELEGQALKEMRRSDSNQYLQNKRGSSSKKVYSLNEMNRVLGGLV